MKITRMDKATARRLSDELLALVKPFAEARGLSVRAGGGTLDSTSLTQKLEFKVLMTDSGESGEKAEFARYAPSFGMTAADYGRTFTVAGRPYKLVGLLPTRRSRPVLGQRDDGKRYVFGWEVLSLMKGPAAGLTETPPPGGRT